MSKAPKVKAKSAKVKLGGNLARLVAPALLVAAIAAVIIAPRPAPPTASDRGMVYTDTVNRLIDADDLQGSLNRPGADKVALTKACRGAPGCYGIVRSFILQSFLKDDMRQASPDVWSSRQQHIVALQPFTRIYYDNDVDHADLPPRIVYASAGVDVSQDQVDRIQLVDLDQGHSCDIGVGDRRAIQPGGLCTAPASGCALSLSAPVSEGRQTYALSLTPQGCGRLYADGRGPLDIATLGTGMIVRVESGVAGARPARVMIAGVSGTMADSDSQGIRFYDHGFVDLARYLERSAPEVTPQLNSANEIRLSLVRSLNLQATAILGDQIRPQVASSGRDIQAGAVLMDGISGEIVAVPSYPFVPRDLVAPDPDGDPRLDRNVNFMNLSIGSAAKVPFATAIVSRWPQLLDLKVADAGPTVGPVLNYPATFESHNHGAPVDFTRFIAESSNRYAMALMAVGLRSGDPFACGKGCVPVHDPLGIWLKDHKVSAIAPAMMKNPRIGGEWRDNLKTYFDIDPANCLDALSYGDATLWGSRRLGNAYELNAPPLCMTQVAYVTPDYYMDTLGGSRSLWSTVFLAQTYDRIVSNRKVEATLLARNGVRDGYHRTPFGPLGIAPEVHDALLTGLKGTLTQPLGTGRRLIAEGTLCDTTSGDGRYVYTCFAKTGTGRIREGEEVHSLALVIEKSAATGDKVLCTRSVMAINIQHRQADATPAITYAIALLKDGLVRRWVDRTCN